MRTYDHGYEDSNKKGKVKRKKRENSNLEKVQRYVTSLSSDQLSRMIDDSTKTYLPDGSDATGQGIYNNMLSSSPIQAKLGISQPQDSSEIQAEKVANAVSNGDMSLSRMMMTQTGAEINMFGEGGMLSTTPEFNEQLESTKGKGTKLSDETRHDLEEYFGTDLSEVNIHTGSEAEELAEGINAKAFTHGQDIYFNEGEFDPESLEGKRLLAHELTHTQQQRGVVKRRIQRAMKFEFQTSNYVLAVQDIAKGQDAKNYNPLVDTLPRKYSPTTEGYKEGSGEEEGKEAAYLAVGKHGLAKGEAYFEEAKGNQLIMKEDKKADKNKPAQFIKAYMFSTQLTTDVINKTVTEVGELKLIYEADHTSILHNPNTFEFYYYNKQGKLLDVHLDENRKFQKGCIKYMKVAREDKKDLDKTKDAQYIERWKITTDTNGSIYSPNLKIRYRVEQVEKTVDNSTISSMKGKYNRNTYEKKYYLSTDFEGDKLKKDAKRLEVHIDEDHVLRNGHIKFMEKKTRDSAKDQTAMELQSETGGALEFETPKWFNDWNELEVRISDAVAMTHAISGSQKLNPADPIDKKIIDAIESKTKRKGYTIVKWPDKEYSTLHLKNLHKDKRSLYVQIVDTDWKAKIQISESIKLSEYASLLKEHEGSFDSNAIITAADEVFKKAYNAYVKSAAHKGKKESDFSQLKGFLQLILNYIWRGQVVDLSNSASKFGFALMARTNFASMYKELLSSDEKDLFLTLLGAPDKPGDNPIFSGELINLVNKYRSNAVLNRKTPFYYKGHKGNPAGLPLIYDWLTQIPKGVDLLAGSAKNVSDAMGAKNVSTDSKDSKYKQALFEVRGTYSHGANSNQELLIKASDWVNTIKEIFQAAKARSSDTPDNPTTPGINESSKTGLNM